MRHCWLSWTRKAASTVSSFVLILLEEVISVYHIEGPNAPLCKYLNIIRNGDTLDPAPRLVWCPRVEDEDKEGENPLHLLAVVAGKHVDFYFLSTIKKASGQSELEVAVLETIAGAIISVDTESEIASVRIR